jgi:hypothetical protein
MGVVAQLGATVTFGFSYSKTLWEFGFGVRSASVIIDVAEFVII